MVEQDCDGCRREMTQILNDAVDDFEIDQISNLGSTALQS
jgi:hypothetical protein